MLCAISGEAPQQPVVSRKSGQIYEKRLIESFIAENGTEPTTGESLTTEDLLDVKQAQVVRPRPPTLTSIPALLGVFQEEWDALALETYTLQQNLAQTRQELSTALYQNDAAVRVIARLTKERDEARDALAKINVGSVATNGSNGDAMQIDNAPLPENVIAKIEATQEKLMKTRRKRPVPEGWATAESISGYTSSSSSDSIYPGTQFLSVNQTGDLILLGGTDGTSGVYSLAQKTITHAWKGNSESITSGIWAGSRAITTTSSGKVSVFEGKGEVASFQVHSGSINNITLHPSGDIVATASDDKSYALYDLQSSSVLTQIFTTSQLTCAQFHPDGHLIAVGGVDGQIKFYDVKSGALAGTFDTGSPLKALCFSENGTWVAAANKDSYDVSIWDLRKVGQTNDPLKTLPTGGLIESLDWDYTAQFLLVGGSSEVSVHNYTKSTKQWSEPLKLAVPSKAVAWGPAAQQIYSVNQDGAILTIQA